MASFMRGVAQAAEGECEKSYGFLPCSTDLGGSTFLMGVYGYILLQGAHLIGDGSEMLLHILDPGIIGGLVLPVLGALPDAIMIVVAGLGVPQEMAQEQVEVGMGTLCGSTIMLLTLAWGGSVWLGRCDFGRRGHAVDKHLKRPADLTNTGVTCDRTTSMGARVMLLSVLLYLTVQVPASFGEVHDPTAALMGAILCILALAAYAVFQVINPDLQKKKMRKAHERFMRYHAISMIAQQMGGLLDSHGRVSRSKVDALFDKFDDDNSGTIDHGELKAMVTGLLIAMGDEVSVAEHVDHWLTEFDVDQGGTVDREEFFKGISKWVEEKRSGATGEEEWLHAETASPHEEGTQDEPLLEGDEEQGEGADEGEDDEEEEEEEDMASWPKSKIARIALIKLMLGTLVCAVFADPMVEAVVGFSKATGIPKFFISFVVTPLASNASELVSSLQFAKKRRQENISLTFSQVYGAVTMNNTLCLGLFLVIVYIQKLDWVYNAEVLVTVIATSAVGLLAWSRIDFPTYLCFPILALFPGSVLIIYFCQKVLLWH